MDTVNKMKSYQTITIAFKVKCYLASGPLSSWDHSDVESDAFLAGPSVYIYKAVLSIEVPSSAYDALESSIAVVTGEVKVSR